MKSVQEIATRLVELCRAGDYDTCYNELFSEDAVSIEPASAPGSRRAEGMAAIRQKGEMWNSMIEAVHGSIISDPVVGGDHFACAMMVDWTMKGQGRTKLEEICVYRVTDGKIVQEEFFY